MARMKPYDELEFVDDFVFCKVMRREEICKKSHRTYFGRENQINSYI